jgi:hypothetical protein
MVMQRNAANELVGALGREHFIVRTIAESPILDTELRSALLGARLVVGDDPYYSPASVDAELNRAGRLTQLVHLDRYTRVKDEPDGSDAWRTQWIRLARTIRDFSEPVALQLNHTATVVASPD